MSDLDEQNQPEPGRRLPRDYYLSHFGEMLDVVGSRYEDLLSEQELEFLERFASAPPDTQKLYVRLAQRKGPWFVAEELAYEEIGSLDAAIQSGLENGLLQPLHIEQLSEFLSTRNYIQLKDLAFDLRLDLRVNKREALAAALMKHADAEQLIDQITMSWSVIQPRYQEALQVIFLLYFGNTHQSLSEFVVEALGHMKYESYSIDESLRRFNLREEIDQKLELKELWESVGELSKEHDLVAIQVIAEILRETDWTDLASRSAQELINHIAYQHERVGLLDEAFQLYEHSEQPPSRERQTRILEKQGRLDEALERALELRRAWSCEDERHFSRVIIPRLANKLGREVEIPKRPKIKRSEIEIQRNFDLLIEDDVLFHLEPEQGFHTQNQIWKSIFGLCFWDIIFMPMAGAFENRFQTRPLDMYEPEFVTRRSAEIEQRMSELREAQFMNEICKKHFDEKSGISNDWVYWDETLQLQVELFLSHIEPDKICEVLQLMLRDLRAYRRGFPDLFVIEDGSAKFYEVKGPGDTLSATQRMWLEELKRTGIESGVLKVVYGPANDEISS